MWRILSAGVIVLSLWLAAACDGPQQQPAPTHDRAATQTAVMERINRDLGATPTP